MYLNVLPTRLLYTALSVFATFTVAKFAYLVGYGSVCHCTHFFCLFYFCYLSKAKDFILASNASPSRDS